VLESYSVANWLRFADLPMKVGNFKMKLKLKIMVEIDLVDFDYIGLPDLYQDEGNCNNFVFGDATHAQYRDWGRFKPESVKNLYDED